MALRRDAQVKAKVAGGQMPMAKYIITKQLTKRPEDYPDAKNQPHVQVALRRKAAGARNGVMQVGRTSCAVRCCSSHASSGQGGGTLYHLSARASLIPGGSHD